MRDTTLALVAEGADVVPMRLVAYCLMPNHSHMALYPRADGDLSKFLPRITLTHTQRDHAQTRTVGYGHIYQGRYKSFPVQKEASRMGRRDGSARRLRSSGWKTR